MGQPVSPVRGDEIRLRRESAGLSQEDLAYQVRDILRGSLKVTARGISKYETGESGATRPNPLLLAAISKVLDCDIDDLAPGMSDEIKQVRWLFDRISCFVSQPQVA